MVNPARAEPVNPDQTGSRNRFRPKYGLLGLSRRLGQVASQPLTDIKEILKKERSLPTTEQLLGTAKPLEMIGIKPKRRDDEQSESLQQLVQRSHEKLARVTTVFPFTLFRDTVIVDRTKVTIIQRTFFWSEDVVSIRIEDVLNATVSTSLIFGSLNIASRVMNSTDHYRIKFFWKNEAMHLKHLIQGYVIAQHNNIQTSHLSKDELIKTLIELGDDTRD